MNKRFTRWASFALLSLLYSSAFAQIQYTGSVNTSGTYTELPATATRIITRDTNNSLSAPYPIGFTFSYNGKPFTEFRLCTKGYIKLGTDVVDSNFFSTTGTGNTGTVFSTAAAGVQMANVIAVANANWIGSDTAQYHFEVQGTAPNRVCVIQYKHLKDGTSRQSFVDVNAQVKLYETSNNIEIVWGTFTPGPAITGTTPWLAIGVGLVDFGTTKSVLKAYKLSTGAWSGVTFNTTNSGDVVNTRQTLTPPVGMTFLFTANPTGLQPGQSASSWKVYPQPARSQVILSDIPAQGLEVALYSLQGQEVRRTRIQEGEALSLEGLTPGTYLLRSLGAQARQTRLVVE